MGETPVYLKARVRTRYPARITRLPWLAGPLVSAGFAKPRGLRRLTRKLAKALFFGLHGRLGLPARGEMEVPTQAGVRRIAINGANTAFLAYAQHLDAGGYEPEVSAFFDHVAAGGGVQVEPIGNRQRSRVAGWDGGIERHADKPHPPKTRRARTREQAERDEMARHRRERLLRGFAAAWKWLQEGLPGADRPYG